MGRTISKGNEPKRKMKNPSDIVQLGFDLNPGAIGP